MKSKHLSIIAAFGFAWVIALGSITNVSAMMGSGMHGMTPANEGVCDELIGGTDGLHVLCVAYCESQDMDMMGDKDTPNNTLLAQYNMKKMETDPHMPCIQTPCSCWTQEELDAITSPSLCEVGSVSAFIRSRTQYASIDTSDPICRFTDRNTGVSVRFEGDALPADAAQTCLTQITDACAAYGF